MAASKNGASEAGHAPQAEPGWEAGTPPRTGVVVLDGNLHVQYLNAPAQELLRGDPGLAWYFEAQQCLSLRIVQSAVTVRDRWLTTHADPVAEEMHVTQRMRRGRQTYSIATTGLPHPSNDFSKYAILVQITEEPSPAVGPAVRAL